MSNVFSSVTRNNERIFPSLDNSGPIGRGIKAYKGLKRLSALSGTIKVQSPVGANNALETIYLNKISCFKFQKAGKVNKSFLKFMFQSDAKVIKDLEDARTHLILEGLNLA